MRTHPRHRSTISWAPIWILVALGPLFVAGCSDLPAGSTRAPREPGVSGAVAIRVPSTVAAPKDGPCIQTTHGCIALNPDVTEATVSQTICMSGYAKSVRPASSYTRGVKTKLLREAGIDESRTSDFELDHIVPLALGGHPRQLSNLELQRWAGEHGARRKDALEVRMHALVCHGAITLTDAQACIAEEWECCVAKYESR